MDWTAVDWIPIAWVIGGVLIILTELVVTGIVAVFFGIGAIVTGLAIALGMPGTGWAPFVLCSVVSIGTLVALRDRFSQWMRGNTVEGGGRGVDDDFVGRDAEVLSGFGEGDAGRGQIRYRGTSWAARSEHALEAGARVRITGRENITLTVAPLEA